ncbi:MAG: hypothetical protein ACD_23C00023G0001 [uncultured bacterium]|nr:MAG: hypothetical protein ACD_23C00023G0001 [uncultured bacterium]
MAQNVAYVSSLWGRLCPDLTKLTRRWMTSVKRPSLVLVGYKQSVCQVFLSVKMLPIHEFLAPFYRAWSSQAFSFLCLRKVAL